MAKELSIVFLYDFSICKKEEDDPMSALLFFAPTWVGETQKLALVGQIMGVTRFFQDNFGNARIITLQSGKFALRFFGRYVLAVGTDRNVAESILQHRSELLSALLRLYHNDIEKISGLFEGQEEQRKNFTDKLYHIFDTYLPILQYNGNIFHNIVLLDLPKSAANIYLDTVQILQSCQQKSGVLGGQILYHNKVIASQLAPDLAKLLVISDPLRLKTVDVISVGFHVPFGAQLMNVYISSKDFHNLRNSAHKAQNSFMNNNPNLLPFTLKRKSINKENVVSGMKRDKSLIFTNIPEEESVYDQQENNVNVKSKIRPTHLPLKFKNMTSKELPESGFSSINFDEFSDSFPEFIGRTSICSTPMTENKILHGNILSICSNTCEELERVDLKVDEKPPLSIIRSEPIKATNIPTTEQKMKKSRKVMGTPRKLKLVPKVTEIVSVDIDLKEEEQQQNHNKSTLKANNLPIDSCNYMHNPYKTHRRRNSWDTLNKIRTKLKLEKSNSSKKSKSLMFNEPHDVDWDSDTEFIDDCETKPSRSITDPTFPVFNSTGDPISKYLFEEFLEFHYTHICRDSTEESQKNLRKELEFLDSEKQNDEYIETNGSVTGTEPGPVKSQESAKISKKGLSLPLKSWNQPLEGGESGKNSFNMFESPAKRNRGLQLTPLMAKLTILAMDSERGSSFEGDYDFTPGSVDPSSLLTRRRSSQPKTDPDTSVMDFGENLEKVDLFVCGQQNMTLVMLLEDGAAQKQKLIQNLFEICVSKLTKTEAQLHQVLNMNVEGADKGGEGSYSFIAIDNKKWDTVKKTGPWSPNELNTVESMHSDMKRRANFTEMILRKDENILYGYQCGNVEIFYQQSHNASAGLPPPSDLFGNVGLTSRRRLERDHAIVLL